MNTIRYNRNSEGKALDNDTLRTLAPSIFSQEAAPSRSSRYQMYPTSAVVDGMRDAGFLPVMAANVHVMRKDVEDRLQYAKHIIRFQQAEHVGAAMGEKPEVVLVNAHDGTSSYRLMAGMFRVVCSNGLVVAHTTVGQIRIPHRSNPLDVVAASIELSKHTPMLMDRVKAMQGIMLDDYTREEMAREAARIRLGEDWRDKLESASQLLALHRYEDMPPTLWNTFNALQENCTRGNRLVRLKPYYVEQNGHMVEKQRRFRSVQSLQNSITINQRLWQMADRVFEQNKTVMV